MAIDKYKVCCRIVNTVGLVAVALATTAVLALYSGVASIRNVEGASMQPTLHTGDKMIIVRSNTYEHGDIVVFNSHKDGTYVKRVIGVPGDRIEVKNGSVYRNGVELYEEYLIAQYTKDGDTSGEVEVPDGKYFVLGDNREVSEDSRYKAVGLIDKSDIIGKYIIGFGDTIG